MKNLIKAADAHVKETHRMTVDLFYQPRRKTCESRFLDAHTLNTERR